MAASCKERGHEAWALRLLAEVEARRERPGAEAELAAATALLADLGIDRWLTVA
jgi:hypothetical protein